MPVEDEGYEKEHSGGAGGTSRYPAEERVGILQIQCDFPRVFSDTRCGYRCPVYRVFATSNRSWSDEVEAASDIILGSATLAQTGVLLRSDGRGKSK